MTVEYSAVPLDEAWRKLHDRELRATLVTLYYERDQIE